MHVDGASSGKGCGARLILINPNEVVIECALRFISHTANNGVKYEALIAGLNIAKEIRIIQIKVFSNSQQVIA